MASRGFLVPEAAWRHFALALFTRCAAFIFHGGRSVAADQQFMRGLLSFKNVALADRLPPGVRLPGVSIPGAGQGAGVAQRVELHGIVRFAHRADFPSALNF